MSHQLTISDHEYRNVDGISLSAQIIAPAIPAKYRLPAIIYIHGGAWRMGNYTHNRNHFLAEYGFFTISIGYRLSYQATFPAQLDDVKAAVRWLRKYADYHHIDPDRIGVWGHSAGAHLAALLGTTGHLESITDPTQQFEHSSRVQAFATLSAPTDFLQMGGSHEDANSPESQLIGGQIGQHPDLVARANPISYVQADAPPALLIHGESDQIVPCSQSHLLAEALASKGNPVELHTFSNTGHNFADDDPAWASARRLILQFFVQQFTLQ
jgi:acetyl esterase/lipase